MLKNLFQQINQSPPFTNPPLQPPPASTFPSPTSLFLSLNSPRPRPADPNLHRSRFLGPAIPYSRHTANLHTAHPGFHRAIGRLRKPAIRRHASRESARNPGNPGFISEDARRVTMRGRKKKCDVHRGCATGVLSPRPPLREARGGGQLGLRRRKRRPRGGDARDSPRRAVTWPRLRAGKPEARGKSADTLPASAADASWSRAVPSGEFCRLGIVELEVQSGCVVAFRISR